MIDNEPIDWEARQERWDKYYKPDTDDWGREKELPPLRGTATCYRCGALVVDTWKHLDWHTKLEGEDWER